MTPAHERLYLQTMRALVAAGVPFVVLGTFALRRHCPRLPRRLVADCDLQLPANPQVLNELVTLLQTTGWRVTLWEQPVTPPLNAAELPGKYYLRARQAGATLDCAYENDFLSWDEFRAVCHWHDGLPLLELEHILRQKEQCARPADQTVLAWWRAGAGKYSDSQRASAAPAGEPE